MATLQVIVLNAYQDALNINVTAAFWFPITSGARPLLNNVTSAWTASSPSVGASAAQNTAIQNGTILEEVRNFSFPLGTTTNSMQAALQQYWTNRNKEVAALGGNQYYGYTWDGTVWVQQ